MMQHTELRCACESRVTKIPDVHNFWDGPDVCAHAVFYLPKNRVATNGDDPVTTPVNPLSLKKGYYMKNKYTMTTDLKALEVYLGSATIIAFDFETAPHEQWKGEGDAALDPHKAHIVGISLSVSEGTGIYIPLCHENFENAEINSIFNFLKNRVFKNPEVLKIAHNLCFEAKFLLNRGIVLTLPVYDTMAAAQMTLKDDHHFRHLGDAGLKTLAWEIFKISLLGFSETVGEKTFGDLDPNDQKTIDYACADADIALRLYHALNHWFKKNIPSHEALIRTLESPVTLFVAMMEHRGFLVDKPAMIQAGKLAETKLNQLKKNLETAGSRFINIGANAATNDFKDYLFKDLTLPVLKQTDTGKPSVDAEALNLTIEYCETHHPEFLGFLRDVMVYRGLSKLHKTYIIGLMEKINAVTGAIHTRFFQLGTETGRFSSQTPNCQNLPASETHGIQVRDFFVDRSGHILVALDYSQIELRIGAWFTKDSKMLEVYKEGGDIHAQTTAAIYNIPLAEARDKTHPDYKLRRTVAKNINFGIFYGLYPKGLQRILKLKADLTLGIEACEAMIFNIHLAYPGLALWQFRVKEAAGYVETVDSALGRRRCLTGINAPDDGLQSHYERAALNHPIQGTAADVLKLAMVRLLQGLSARPFIHPLLTVHDEIVFEVENDSIEKAVPWLKASMEENPFDGFDVPIVTEVSLGQSYGSLKPWVGTVGPQ